MASNKSVYSSSKEYVSFRGSVSLKKQPVDHKGVQVEWKLYDHGPKHIRCPIVFLPPASGTADVFFNQIMSLSTLGYRVIAVDHAVVWSHLDWCECFLKLLDSLNLDQVHLFGASLGGFLAQKFAEYTARSQRVQSVTLCNAFVDTSVFDDMPPTQIYSLCPTFYLKRLILANFPEEELEPSIADSVDFMVEQLDRLSRTELASRLTLNTAKGYVQPQKLSEQSIKVMLLDVLDKTAISQGVREELAKCYPEARVASLKSGGNFPYLCRSEEVNMFVRVHLRQFEPTRYSACESSTNNDIHTES